jgi:hypothetical protein
MPVRPDLVHAFTPPQVRSLASLCDLARLARCGYCFAGPNQFCNGVGLGRPNAVHLARFASAAVCGLIRSHEISVVLELAGDTFTSGTVIGGRDAQTAPDISGSAVGEQVRVARKGVGR